MNTERLIQRLRGPSSRPAVGAGQTGWDTAIRWAIGVIRSQERIDRATTIDSALVEAQARLPSKEWTLLVGQTIECPFCPGWWATASTRDPETRYPIIVTSESGRPRGEHHDPNPAAALRELTNRLPHGGSDD